MSCPKCNGKGWYQKPDFTDPDNTHSEECYLCNNIDIDLTIDGEDKLIG